MFELIKAERKLSYSNWRYRLLHWTFDIKVKNNVLRGPLLPQYLYTHYCPLFHLTNILFVLSPLILLFKLLFKFLYYIGICGTKILESFRKFQIRSIHIGVSNVDVDVEMGKQKEKRRIISELKRYNFLWSGDKQKAYIMEFFGCKFLSEDEVYDFYLDACKKIIAANELAEQKRKLCQERILLFINLSRVVIKTVLTIVSVVSICVVGYALIFYGIPLFVGLCSFMLSLLQFTASNLLEIIIGTVVATTLLIVVFGLLSIVQNDKYEINNTIMKGVCAPFQFIGKMFNIGADFISQVYEDNCPPITIVSETDELISEISDISEE